MDARKKKQILILGSGPATDIKEFFTRKSNNRFNFDLVDACNQAIQYASKKLVCYEKRINFLHTNIIRIKLQKKYDLIWSGGVFDYIKDKHFIRFLRKFYDCLRTGGKMIIGNFSPNNISKEYMEKVGNWYLQYRSIEDLIRLAKQAGITQKNIKIDSEDLGINLFMHLKR